MLLSAVPYPSKMTELIHCNIITTVPGISGGDGNASTHCV
jgi:hypothetical protein